MENQLRIAGYCRISVDEELDRDNTSIENQKSLISDYVERTFPGVQLDFFEDRDRSGYTFEQRENYQILRKKLFRHEYDILIVKDFSRFSRRTSRGLCELEDLRDAGIRIISIGDGIDFPTSDDWMAIQFRFLVNEMPVTDTSKKVRSVISNRQKHGDWICAVPYGYVMVNSKAKKYRVDEESAAIVRKIFELYINGWGYKKIANYLTEQNIPTPRKVEEMRKEAAGEDFVVRSKKEWSIVSISEILSNDFYIGRLRQGKYRRKKINGDDVRVDESDHIVFENCHEPIVDYKTFAVTQELIKQRANNGYHGVQKYPNVYTGHLFCGDCGSPMFSMSRGDIPQAYRCGTYHRHGTTACSSHHIRVETLDEMLKSFIRKIKENSQEMLDDLQRSLEREKKAATANKNIVEALTQKIEDTKAELKFLNIQHAKTLAKHPEQEEMLEEVYQEQVAELTSQIDGLKNQIDIANQKHNAVIEMNRKAKTVMEVFDEILNKPTLSKIDVDFLVDRIDIYTDHIDIKLRSDIDALLRTGIPEDLMPEPAGAAANFKCGTKKTDITSLLYPKPQKKRGCLSVHLISDGDPLEIYTSSDGEVIFKKYSAIGEMSENASQVADIMRQLAGCPVVVFDRDHVIATSGVTKREFQERRVSPELEELMENRRQYYAEADGREMHPVEGVNAASLAAMPILSAGDVTGAVAFLANGKAQSATELQRSLVSAAAQFLGRQVE